MKKYLLSFILSVAAFASANAGYTGILVTDNGGQKTYYLFEEQPTVKYQEVSSVMNACLYVKGETNPVVSVPLTDGAKLTVRYDDFVRVSLNTEGYATFSAKDASFIATAGITAYKAAVDGELITLTALEGNIPAGTGVILYGETPGTKVDLPVATTTDNNADVTGNVLLATTKADGSLAEKVANAWALGAGKQFLQYTGAAFVHNRAYLVHEKTAGAKAMRIVFDNEADGLDAVISEKSREGKIIENGSIVIVKNGMKYNVAGQVIK